MLDGSPLVFLATGPGDVRRFGVLCTMARAQRNLLGVRTDGLIAPSSDRAFIAHRLGHLAVYDGGPLASQSTSFKGRLVCPRVWRFLRVHNTVG